MRALFDDDDDDSPPAPTRVCMDCASCAPPTDTNFTLISAKFGWRLTRTVDANGRASINWRCPACWERHKNLTSSGPRPAAAAASALPLNPSVSTRRR